jgi:P-type Cu+ transporter
MKRIVGAVLIGLLWTAASAAEVAASARAVLAVKGMMCSSCATTVEKTLRALPGVTGVILVLKQDRATVTYDPRLVTPQAMTAALRRAGFRATPQPPAR